MQNLLFQVILNLHKSRYCLINENRYTAPDVNEVHRVRKNPRSANSCEALYDYFGTNGNDKPGSDDPAVHYCSNDQPLHSKQKQFNFTLDQATFFNIIKYLLLWLTTSNFSPNNLKTKLRNCSGKLAVRLKQYFFLHKLKNSILVLHKNR